MYHIPYDVARYSGNIHSLARNFDSDRLFHLFHQYSPRIGETCRSVFFRDAHKRSGTINLLLDLQAAGGTSSRDSRGLNSSATEVIRGDDARDVRSRLFDSGWAKARGLSEDSAPDPSP